MHEKLCFLAPPGAIMTLTASEFLIILKMVACKLLLRYEGWMSKNMAAIPLFVKITKNKGFFGPHVRPSVITFTKIRNGQDFTLSAYDF